MPAGELAPSRNVLITGASRSGTTLIERLADAHPDASVVSQPFPYFYRAIKANWLDAHGWSQPYPLDGLFDESRYTNDDFSEHLATLTLTASEIRGNRGFHGRVRRVLDT